MKENTKDFLEGLGELPEVDASQYDVNQIMAEFSGAPIPPSAETEDFAPVGEILLSEMPPPSPVEENAAEEENASPALASHHAEILPPRPAVEEIPTVQPTKSPPTDKAFKSFKRRRKSRPHQTEDTTASQPEPSSTPEPAPNPLPDPTVAMEDIVSNTVGAVLEEQAEERQEATRKMKQRQKKTDRSYQTKTKAPSAPESPAFSEEEPSLVEATVRMKRLRRRLARLAAVAGGLTVLFWTLALLPDYGVSIPYYTGFPQRQFWAALILHVVIMGCAWPVFARAVQELRQLRIGWGVMICLGAVVSLLDTATAPILPDRCAGQSFGGISMAALTLALHGLCSEATGYRETFRLAALGKPTYVVDAGPNGAVKGEGNTRSFYSRAVSEDSASAWQRVLLPVLLTADVVFALICSVGQSRFQDFLWCFSAILTAGTAFSLPLVYGLPFARLSLRLSQSGGAVAGSYGAQRFSHCREIILGDSDLFPPGSVRMVGKKVIAEDRRKVAAYVGSLAEELGACYTPLMQSFMQEEGAKTMPMVHFHIHEDGGASASIRGETAILGSAYTLRKQAVRLPRSLEQKEGLYLAIDGQLSAIFALEYSSREGVQWALHGMKRSDLTPLLSLRDGSLTPKFLKQKFGSNGGAILLDAAARSSLVQPGRAMEAQPNGLLYREGLAPFFEVVAGGKRLAYVMRLGNLISLSGSALGVLLGYYLAFSGAVTLLTPSLLMGFLLLWLLPVMVLSWSVDRL